MEISARLRDALARYHRFLLADDLERDRVIQRADAQALTDLADTVEPLLDEIDSTLDRLTAAPHPLSDEDETLEIDLNSLAQAASEARMEAERRLDTSSR